MTANWTRLVASQSVLAPRSSITTSLSPSDGSSAASAGRSIPGIVRSASFAIAISAPVLPAETAPPASPRFTASIASPIELPRPLRSAWLGLSSPRSEEHTSELQSLMRNSYAVFCFKKKKQLPHNHTQHIIHTDPELTL